MRSLALGLAEFVTGLLSIADRDLLVPRSGEVVPARALRERTLFSKRTSGAGAERQQLCERQQLSERQQLCEQRPRSLSQLTAEN